MKGLVALILLAGVGYFGYMHIAGSQSSEAYQVYEAFAEKLDHSNYAGAMKMVSAGSAAEETVRQRRSWQALYDLKVTQSQRTLESKQVAGNGERAEYRVSQSTFTVPGMTPPALPDFLIAQHVVLVREGRSWRVDAFTEKITSLGSR